MEKISIENLVQLMFLYSRIENDTENPDFITGMKLLELVSLKIH